MPACKNCGSTQVDEDGAHGYTICMGCGNVLEDQVTFIKEIVISSRGRLNCLVGSDNFYMISDDRIKVCKLM